jgi:hypothetical protein
MKRYIKQFIPRFHFSVPALAFIEPNRSMAIVLSLFGSVQSTKRSLRGTTAVNNGILTSGNVQYIFTVLLKETSNLILVLWLLRPDLNVQLKTFGDEPRRMWKVIQRFDEYRSCHLRESTDSP